MKRQFFKPSVLGVLLMLCLLVVHATSMRGTSMSTVINDADGSRVTQVDYTYGLPTLLRVATRGPSEAEQRTVGVHPHWGTIAGVLVVAWCLSMAVGRWVTGYVRRDGTFAGPQPAGGWRHPAAVVGYVLAGCALVSIACAIVFHPMLNGSGSRVELSFAFFVLLMVVAVPVTLIVLIVRRWVRRARDGRRGFPVEFAPHQA